jgi:secernin
VCDTLVVVAEDGTWFAKNSDRPPDEVQLFAQHGARAPGAPLRSQYLDLGSDPGAHRITLAAQPTWLWGFETGINEHRVAIGNETVYTTADRHSAPAALLGMDLVRLALERSNTADAARVALCALVEQYGQGGSGWEHRDEPYFSSFLIADPLGAWIVETSQRSWVARPVATGAAISNRLSIGTDWTLASPDIRLGSDWQVHRDPKAPTAIADHRLAVTTACARRAPSFAAIAATLRDHGPTRPALPTSVGDDWSGVSVCMHVRGYQATASSVIAWLPRDPRRTPRYWAALGSPCVSVYVPVDGDTGLPDLLGDARTWHRFARLRERVEADPTGIDELHVIRAALDPIESELVDDSSHRADSAARLDAALRSLEV